VMLLVAVLLAHLQCNGSCNAEILKLKGEVASSSAEPPCHQHEQPTGSSQPHKDAVDSCNERPLIVRKAGATVQPTLDVAMTLPLAPALIRHATEAQGFQSLTNDLLGKSISTGVTSVLSI